MNFQQKQETLENIYLSKALKEEGVLPAMIAEKFEVNVSTVKRWLKSPLIIEKQGNVYNVNKLQVKFNEDAEYKEWVHWNTEVINDR